MKLVDPAYSEGDRIIEVRLKLSEGLVRDADQETLSALLGMDAARQAKSLLAEVSNG